MGVFESDGLQDTVHAVRFAMSVFSKLQRQVPHVETAIGVSSGRVYVGTVGSEGRKELAVIGRAMNTAARLMGKAGAKGGLLDNTRARRNSEVLAREDIADPLSNPANYDRMRRGFIGGILVDSDTATRTSAAIRYTELGPIVLKGKETAMSVFQPIVDPEDNIFGQHEQRAAAESEKETERTWRNGTMVSVEDIKEGLIGREIVIDSIYRACKALQGNSHGSAVLICGESGSGKTCLVKAAQGLFQSCCASKRGGADGPADSLVLRCRPTNIDQNVAYSAISPAVEGIFQLNGKLSKEEREIKVSACVSLSFFFLWFPRF